MICEMIKNAAKGTDTADMPERSSSETHVFLFLIKMTKSSGNFHQCYKGFKYRDTKPPLVTKVGRFNLGVYGDCLVLEPPSH